MKILALELSSPRGSIAFRAEGRERFAAQFANDRKHSGFFFENLQHCVQQCGPAERIVVGLGPGSYAGTRIAIAAAIGLQAATGAQLGGLTSLVALPTDAPQYAMIGDARRQSFYFARVAERICVEGPLLCSAEELAVRLEAIDVPVFSTEPVAGFASTVKCPSASLLAELAANQSTLITLPPLEPIYLREPHITQPRGATR